MKFHLVLEEILGKKSDIAILRVLVEKDLELTGRQIAQLTGLNHRTCQLSLKNLVTQGIVSLRKIGKSNLFKLKRENVLVKNGILPLFEAEHQLLSTVQFLISDKLGTKKILSLILFGSVALGQEKPDSDLDVCVIVADEESKVFVEQEEDLLSQTIIKLFGNSLALYSLTVDEFNKRYFEDDELIKGIIRNERVFWGKSLKEILKDDQKR
ncbi:MAG TPA: hypothetical protein ENN38_02165 [Actinobacteria bacterium]|nr:hypothetical protein [Actinomycetota bacterium]